MSDVPCNGCRVCCQMAAVILMPGDDISKYQIEGGDEIKMLAHKENGDCIYLEDSGCGIYAERPIMCRQYDCRKQYLSLTKAKRSAYVKSGLVSEDEFEEGKKRQYTLTHEERQQCVEMRKDA